MHPIHERPRDGCVWHRRRYSAGGSHSSSAGTGRSGAGGWRAREAPPVRRRAGPAQRAGGAEDEVSLARFWRRTYLGHVSRRPPDGGRLGLRSACPANTSSTSSASTSDSLGSSAAAATTMLRLPVFTGAGEPGNGMALRRHRPAVHPRVRITRTSRTCVRVLGSGAIRAAGPFGATSDYPPPSDGKSPKYASNSSPVSAALVRGEDLCHAQVIAGSSVAPLCLSGTTSQAGPPISSTSPTFTTSRFTCGSTANRSVPRARWRRARPADFASDACTRRSQAPSN